MALLRGNQKKPRSGARWLGAVALAVLSVFAAAQPADEAGKEFTEYEVKAAFLINFAKYVEWPDKAFPESDSPFKIGVLGPNPFGDTLKRLASDQELDGRKITIKQSDNIEELIACHIVFLPGPDRKSTSTELEIFKELPVLTVGEQAGFAEQGGTVNFVLVETKVKFEINTASANRTDLKVSPRLLRLAVRRYE